MSQCAEVTRRVRHPLIKLVKRCRLSLDLNDTKKENQEQLLDGFFSIFFGGGALNDK